MKVRYVVQGKGPAVILAHGLGVSLTVWRENIAPLARGHTVYAFDFPGHGESEKPGDIEYTPVSGARLLFGLMDALGIGRASLIGNSGGGLVAAFCALENPERVDKLVLVDSAGLGRDVAWFLRFCSLPIVGELLHAPNVRTTRGFINSAFYGPAAMSDGVAEEIMRARNIPEAKRAALKAVRSAINPLGLRKDLMILHRLKDLKMPLLVIWGREDRITPVSHAYRAAEVLPEGSVHIISRCGHWPQMEKAQEFNRLVLRFLDGA